MKSRQWCRMKTHVENIWLAEAVLSTEAENWTWGPACLVLWCLTSWDLESRVKAVLGQSKKPHFPPERWVGLNKCPEDSRSCCELKNCHLCFIFVIRRFWNNSDHEWSWTRSCDVWRLRRLWVISRLWFSLKITVSFSLINNLNLIWITLNSQHSDLLLLLSLHEVTSVTTCTKTQLHFNYDDVAMMTSGLCLCERWTGSA